MIFKTEPLNFRPLFSASGCYIIDPSGKFLIMQYVDSKGATWGPPGGKQESGETISQAMLRELKEETGFLFSKSHLQKIETCYIRYPEFEFIYSTFYVRVNERKEPTLDGREHQAFKWVTPSEALTMDLIRDEDGCIKRFFFEAKN